jgi:hypothetical protein
VSKVLYFLGKIIKSGRVKIINKKLGSNGTGLKALKETLRKIDSVYFRHHEH